MASRPHSPTVRCNSLIPQADIQPSILMPETEMEIPVDPSRPFSSLFVTGSGLILNFAATLKWLSLRWGNTSPAHVNSNFVGRSGRIYRFADLIQGLISRSSFPTVMPVTRAKSLSLHIRSLGVNCLNANSPRAYRGAYS